MNWLLIVAILVLFIYAIVGYKLGFLRMVFSVGKWFLLVALVIMLTPGLASFLSNHTPLQTKIEVKIENRLEERITKMAGESVSEEESNLEAVGIGLPDSVTEKVPALVGAALVDTEACSTMANAIADLAVKGIAGAIIIVIGFVLIIIIGRLLKLVDKIPVVGDTNKVLGIFMGLAKGMILIWVFMAIVAMEVGTGPGQFFYSFISESKPLNFVYENNLILTVVMAFF